ncbi:MAG: hypothetical protein HQM09_20700 [Candidatus Riflebacteria bacterium]|nr:hypothetical protein [Candidatus Riflebacteria bacterium]
MIITNDRKHPTLASLIPTASGQLVFCVVLYVMIMPPLLYWAWRFRRVIRDEMDIDARLGPPGRLAIQLFLSQVILFFPDLTIMCFRIALAPLKRQIFPGLMGAGVFWLVAGKEAPDDLFEWPEKLKGLIGSLPTKDLVPTIRLLLIHGLLKENKSVNEKGAVVRAYILGPVGLPLAKRFKIVPPGSETV